MRDEWFRLSLRYLLVMRNYDGQTIVLGERSVCKTDGTSSSLGLASGVSRSTVCQDLLVNLLHEHRLWYMV